MTEATSETTVWRRYSAGPDSWDVISSGRWSARMARACGRAAPRSRLFPSADRAEWTDPAGAGQSSLPGFDRRCARGRKRAVNATGVKAESGAQTYTAVHVEGALALARAAAARPRRPCAYFRDRRGPDVLFALYREQGAGEQATRDTFPAAIVLRPSVVFGPEDDFFNRFGASACHLPFLPLLGGGETRLQPVYVGDVGQAVAAAVSGFAKPGAAYELGGPRTMTFREAAELTLRAIDRRRLFIGAAPRAIALDCGFESVRGARRHSGFFRNC